MQYIGNNQITAKYVGNTEVQKQYVGDTLVWENTPPTPQHDYSQDYLTFKITSDGMINWVVSGSAETKTIQYSKDNGANWTSITSTTAGTQIQVTTGDVVLFKGNYSYYGGSNAKDYNSFKNTSAGFEVCGNIMSMISGDSFTSASTFSDAAFRNFFRDCTGLTSAENLILPTWTKSTCYNSMFLGCNHLTTVPVLPATGLSTSCYSYMFTNCSRLTTAPVLPATSLGNYCYEYMFQGCGSLTTAPALPATTLQKACYQAMFINCGALTSAPVLSAATLVDSCYSNMFQGCSSLNYIKCLATNISANKCVRNWVLSVAASGTFVKATGVNWETGTNGIPSGWTVEEV